MNLKKFALKGLIILAVFVALCMFFSGTIKTISTAKVRLYSPKNGKLEEKIELAGKIAFPDVERLSVEVDNGQTITIKKVNTRVGYTVKAGDVLIEAEVTGYDAALQECEANYNTAMDGMLALESKSGDIRIRRSDEAYAAAYYALRDAKQAALKLGVAVQSLLDKAGATLPEEGYPEGADEALTAAIDQYRQALADQDAAQEAFQRASRYSVDEATWSYMTQRQTYQDQMDQAQEKMRSLSSLKARVEAISAPRDAYVAEVNVKEGDVFDGSSWLLSITQEGKNPVLRADLSNVERNIVKGTTVNISTTRYGTLETQVLAAGTAPEGGKYADVEITQNMLDALGSVYSLTQTETPMSLVYRAKENTCLLPSSAVHGTGDERYVFVVNKEYNSFGNSSMKVAKYAVTVLGEVDGTVSIQEDISYYTLAYMEDRQIKDGDSVMEYTD